MPETETNINKIIHKIRQSNSNVFEVYDVMKASIAVNELQEVIDAYQTLIKSPQIEVVKLRIVDFKPNCCKVSLIVTFDNSILGEVIIQYGH